MGGEPIHRLFQCVFDGSLGLPQFPDCLLAAHIRWSFRRQNPFDGDGRFSAKESPLHEPVGIANADYQPVGRPNSGRRQAGQAAQYFEYFLQTHVPVAQDVPFTGFTFLQGQDVAFNHISYVYQIHPCL